MQISTTIRDEQLEAFCEKFDDGYLEIWDASVPASVSAPIVGGTLLATLRFGDPAFAAVDGDIRELNPIDPVTGVAAGNAAFARGYRANGTTAEADFSVGLSGSGADLIMSTLVVADGKAVEILSGYVALPLGSMTP